MKFIFKFVIIRKEDGKYVAMAENIKSYTTKIFEAKIFENREEAQNNACENEFVSIVDFNSGN